ncbi:MAG: FAD-binding oxidoreductase [Salinarimonadaceae bacterium]|nr:MAG: FAD-binding oxidoreductase [Salinarimonadaceae bacterium]
MTGERYDLAVVGGGIMGCAAAIHACGGGLNTIVIEQGAIGSGASGVNAGTLSLQIKRLKLMPYALKSHAIWREAGKAVGFRRIGGYTLAFTEREAEFLTERMALKREAGAPIRMVSLNEVADKEPGLSRSVVAASYCEEDGDANSSLMGVYYRHMLREAGVAFRERDGVMDITREKGDFVLRAKSGTIRAKRLLLAAGAWLGDLLPMLGSHLPITVRVNTVSVTEPGPPVIGSIIGHATGLLSLKQKSNGCILIGGGWQGTGRPAQGRGEVNANTLLTNLRLARHVAPGIANRRLLRSWTGYEAHVPDFYPLAGRLPGVENAFVLGCVRGGFTIGPYIGRLMGDLILGREPELPLFDPARFAPGSSNSTNQH